MSRYEWETAELTLPTAAVAGLKKTVRDSHNALRAKLAAAATTFWNDHAKKTRSTRLYTQRLEAWRVAKRPGGLYSPDVHVTGLPWDTVHDLADLMKSLADRPRKLTSADLDKVMAKATNRTTVFAYGEFSATFNGRKLSWHVSENNHACDHAHEHPVAKALFAALDRVNWTRGTGGEMWGSDENARAASEDYGYDSVSQKQHWGPLGAQAFEDRHGFKAPARLPRPRALAAY